MPNWCYNSLIVKGKKTELEKFKKFMCGDNTWFDLGKVVSADDHKTVVRVEWDNMTTEQKREWIIFAKTDEDGFEQYWFNKGGYEWNVKHWGTKWNTDCEEPHQTETELNYSFDTAWSPCEPIIKILIKQFPTLKFEFHYEEVGMGFEGVLEGKDGKITKESSWETDCYDCPKCENTTSAPKDEDEVECSDCGHIFKKKDVDDDDN